MAEPVQQATVMDVRDLSPSVRELTVLPEHPITFLPGQWVSLNLPAGPRPPLVRAYSMAEPQAPSGQLVLVFDRVPSGLGSSYLFKLKPEDTVPLSGPYGHFIVPRPVPPALLLVARFTGIVPIRCILRHLTATARLPRTILIYSAPSRAELIYDDEFQKLAASHGTFQYHPLVPDGPAFQPEEDLVCAAIRNDPGAFPMVAGTKAFVRPLRARLSEMGIDRRAMRHETYD